MLDRVKGWQESPTSDAVAPELNTPQDESARSMRRRAGSSLSLVLSSLFFIGLLYLVWEAVVLAAIVPDFIVPAPLQVLHTFGVEISSGELQANTIVTLEETLGGFGLALLVAAAAGYAIAHSRLLEVFTLPFVATSQAVPIIAVAPLIILLFHSGVLPKVMISAVIAVFPLLITIITGLRGVQRDYLDLARVFGASRWQTVMYIEIPLALPTILGGMKLGLTLSLTGAVVGEFVSAEQGLGFMINSAIGNFEVSTRYVGLITLALLGVLLFGFMTRIERILLQWYVA